MLFSLHSTSLPHTFNFNKRPPKFHSLIRNPSDSRHGSFLSTQSHSESNSKCNLNSFKPIQTNRFLPLHSISARVSKLNASNVSTPVEHDWSVEKLKQVLVSLRNGFFSELASNSNIVYDAQTQTIKFPPTLSAKQRRRAHEVAERLGLGHESFGQDANRYFTARLLSSSERLQKLRELIDEEEMASREQFEVFEKEKLSWRGLEAQKLLLYQAKVLERVNAAFGRERWVLGDGVGKEREGHVSRFSQRARPGSSVRLAEKNGQGYFCPSEDLPRGRVAWARGGKLCILFDRSFAEKESEGGAAGEEEKERRGKEEEKMGQVKFHESETIDLMLTPDFSTFDRMRNAISVCERSQNDLKSLIDALLSTSLLTSSQAHPNQSKADPNLDFPEPHSEPRSQDMQIPQVRKATNVPVTADAFLDSDLNQEQLEAVRLGLFGPEDGLGADVAIIHGPFGTGKTRVLVEIVRRKVLGGCRVLVLASSNAAVDKLAMDIVQSDPHIRLTRVGIKDRISPAMVPYSLEVFLENHPNSILASSLRKKAMATSLTSKKWFRSSDGAEKRREARKESNSLFRDARKLEESAMADVLRNTRVMCGTLTGFSSSLNQFSLNQTKLTKPKPQVRDLIDFDCVVVDEASQALSPSLLIPLPYLRSLTSPSISEGGRERMESFNREMLCMGPRLILAGDHRQLPPTVLSEGRHGVESSLSFSLFEELIERDGGGLGRKSAMDLIDDTDKDRLKKEILETAIKLSRPSASLNDYGIKESQNLDGEGKRIIQKVEEKEKEKEKAKDENSFLDKGCGRFSRSLKTQYRMPAGLMSFPSAAFYDGQLVSDVASSDSLISGDASILRGGCVFEVIDTAGAGFEEEKEQTSASASFLNLKNASEKMKKFMEEEFMSTCNRGHANLAVRMVKDLISSWGLEASQIGLISPYSAQVALLRELLHADVANGLQIDSVDGFQGREKDVIILDCVRSNSEGNVGFLSDYRRLNVAITRAKKKLVVIADSATLSTDMVWDMFFEWSSMHDNFPSGLFSYRSIFELPPEEEW